MLFHLLDLYLPLFLLQEASLLTLNELHFAENTLVVAFNLCLSLSFLCWRLYMYSFALTASWNVKSSKWPLQQLQLRIINKLTLFPSFFSPFSCYVLSSLHLYLHLFSVHFTVFLFCIRGHLQGGSSLSSSVTSSSARRVRQLPQLPPQSSSAEQGTMTTVCLCFWVCVSCVIQIYVQYHSDQMLPVRTLLLTKISLTCDL